jgi:nucleoside-diphosphate-sugar epimerase
MRVLVTGGGGFLGRSVVETCLARGHAVSALGRGAYPDLEALGVRCFQADLSDAAAVSSAVAGHDAVVHAAAKTGIVGKRADFWSANVDGTRHVLAACRQHGVERLVHTGSPSTTFDGRDHVRVATDLPHARRFLAPYPESKAASERLVLEANRKGLATCVLRPHLIIGPRDPHLTPRLVRRGRKRELVIVGDGTNEVSLTWVDDGAAAHVAALEALEPGARHAGKAYFIAQREPVKLWDWINGLFARLGIVPVTRHVPLRTAYAVGWGLELLWRVLPLPGEPELTRFLALELARSHSYDPAPAERDFGWRPALPMAEATERLLAYMRELAREPLAAPAGNKRPSPV